MARVPRLPETRFAGSFRSPLEEDTISTHGWWSPSSRRKIGAEIIVENLPGAGGAVSANKLKLSKPDGLTLGIVNAPGLLVSALSGETEAPNPARDFTVLGRLVRQRAVWCAAANSQIRSLEDVLMTAGKRKILFAISEAGSTNFVNVIVGSALLNIDAECISGFGGSRGSALAVLRGEADLLSLTFESALDHIEAGDLRPLLQIAGERISSHSSLDGVALLCGDDGMAAHRAVELGHDVARARDDAQALDDLTGSGIVIAGPLGLEEGLFRCLEQNLHEALSDPGFHAAAAGARRSLDVARADEARAELENASGTAQRFIPLVRESIRKLRSGG